MGLDDAGAGGRGRSRAQTHDNTRLSPGQKPGYHGSHCTLSSLISSVAKSGGVAAPYANPYGERGKNAAIEGSCLAQLVKRVSSAARTALTEQVRRAYCAELTDGPRSFAAVAWACRGTVPN